MLRTKNKPQLSASVSVVKRAILFALLATFTLTGCTVKKCNTTPVATPTPVPSIYDQCAAKKCNITVWYPFGDTNTDAIYQSLAKQYSQQDKHQNITVTTINKQTFGQYSSQILEKRGSSEAPDIYLIRSDGFNKYEKERALPLSSQPEPANSTKKSALDPNVQQYIEAFPPGFKYDLVEQAAQTTPTAQDSTKKDMKLYGAPLFYQGMALFINKKIFTAYNLANQDSPITIPTRDTVLSWSEFGTLAIKLTQTKDGWLKAPIPGASEVKLNITPGSIFRFGTALGTSKNIPYAVDILTLYMQQSGIPIVSADRTKAAFDDDTTLDSSAAILNSFVGYSKLWDTSYESSLKAFKDGKVAMIFARSYNVKEVLAIPELDVDFIPIPQVSKKKEEWITDNYYWSLTVNSDTKYGDIAWDFIKFITAKDNLKKFSLTFQQPTTRLDLLQELQQDKEYDRLFGVFNLQLPYAKGYFKGKQEPSDKVFSDAIESANTGKDSGDGTLQISRQAVNQAGEAFTRVLQDNPYN
ncbi:MAG: extracellular solute-binding protein [bacterium]